MFHLAKDGDIPPEGNQTAGQEAIALVRRALEIRTQLYGTEHPHVADAMKLLADALDYFNNVDDNEVIRLYEQSIAIHARVEGSLSVNVDVGKMNLGIAYHNRAKRARAAHDLNRELTSLEQALPNYSEAARIFRATNREDETVEAEQRVVQVEEKLCQARKAIGAATRG